MTESEWLACDDPRLMLAALPTSASERKLRLFAVTCASRVVQLLRRKDEKCARRAIDVALRFADGRADREELYRESERAYSAAFNAIDHPREDYDHITYSAVTAAYNTLADQVIGSLGRIAPDLRQASYHAACAEAHRTGDSRSTKVTWDRAFLAEGGKQAPFLRDIFGPLPFRPVTVNPTWQTSNVTALATSIYHDRAFERLPILADALEDAGCDNGDILNHCRQPGEHVRGCWVVDLVLEKE